MDKYVFDSYALIAFFRGEPESIKIAALLAELSQQNLEAQMVSINVGEVYYMLCRKGNASNATLAIDKLLKFPIQIIVADLTLALEAASIKSKFSLSYADAFAAALTIKTNATLITNDLEFEPLTSIPNFKKTTLAALPF
jgi:predicted nucleic acid-binding protein